MTPSKQIPHQPNWPSIFMGIATKLETMANEYLCLKTTFEAQEKMFYLELNHALDFYELREGVALDDLLRMLKTRLPGWAEPLRRDCSQQLSLAEDLDNKVEAEKNIGQELKIYCESLHKISGDFRCLSKEFRNIGAIEGEGKK